MIGVFFFTLPSSSESQQGRSGFTQDSRRVRDEEEDEAEEEEDEEEPTSPLIPIRQYKNSVKSQLG